MLVGMASLPHSHPPEQRHFTVETGKTAYNFAAQCTGTFHAISNPPNLNLIR